MNLKHKSHVPANWSPISSIQSRQQQAKHILNYDNYIFFLKKIKTYVLPYCDILAWCLMPNHFHLMMLVNKLEAELTYSSLEVATPDATLSRARNTDVRTDTLQKSFGILLASYTRAVNKQQKRSGSLFRNETKAECITCIDEITPSFIDTSSGTSFLSETPERQYPQICYSYILNNPVVAGLVAISTDWEFSSARDVAGLRNGKLINRDVIEEYGLKF